MKRDTPNENGSADATDASAESTTASTEPTGDRLGDVDHTHPYRNTTFGSVFARGPTVAADGGVPAASDDGAPCMADVAHESPTGTDASDAFERGTATTGANGGVPDDE